jgi:hypothetical protein
MTIPRGLRANPEWHREQVIKAVRYFFECGATVEEGLDAVMEAARREFGTRVIIRRPCEMRIDGYDYRWPLSPLNSKG